MKTQLTRNFTKNFLILFLVGIIANVSTVNALPAKQAATNTVVDVIVNSADHETLEAAVIAADLVTTLSGTGPFTVFAPTDAAFDLLPDGVLTDLLADPSGALTDILLYHVIGSTVLSTDLTDGQMATTLFLEDVKVTINADGVFINDAKVTAADIVADNGVVHVIDMVLTPPTNTVVDIIVNSDVHETLEAAVIAADLAGTLSGDGPFTVFAPTDAAFGMLPDGALTDLLADPSGALTDILLYHVIGAKVMSTDLTDGQMATTLLMEDVKVTINTDGVFINDAKVIVADIEADNGVVHVIDMVLTPPTNTVVDIIVNSDVHETLEAAVIAADLAGTLSGDGPFTVFAPTDAAFGMLPDGALTDLLADPSGALTDILLYHVIGAKVMSTDLTDGQMATTLLMEDVMVTINDDGVFINDAKVTAADIEADNGVVHVIDMVLTPPTNTVVDIIVNSDVHETLEAAVIAADLAGTLSGDGPFTVFAPTDAAFGMLPDGALTDLLADPSGALTDILLYHVIGAKVMSTDLTDGQMATTLFMKDVKVTINDDGVFINDAKVIVADIEADNGVVHVIDAVISAPADVQISENQDYGSILTDSNGNTLYFFTPDADGSSSCVDGCLDNWPVFYQPSIIAGSGLDASDFGSIDRGAGVMQTTYKGWPLYYFTNDNTPGETKGEGLIGKWFVAKPDYSIMIVDNQLVGNDGKNYTSDYTEGDEITQYFTDSEGNTLYTWINDNYNKNNFTLEDFSNNGVWPVYEEDGMVFPSTLNSSAFNTIDVFGKTQMTYKGWPLYYFGQDATRGETKGVSVPAPGVWPVAMADMMEANYATVVEIIVNSEVHETLEAAVIAADLAGTLSGDGPFTVFAPTDAAFEMLPEGTLTSLLADPSGALTDILLYHVIGAKVMSTDLTDGQMATTLFMEDVKVTINTDGVFINDAKVIVADIEADNGVVHVIDMVLTPPTNTVVDIIVNSDVHETLEAAVIAADLAGTLSGDGPFTVFAPTDAAFAMLPDGALTSLLADPSGALTDILLYHVIGAKVMSTDLTDGQMATTLFMEDVKVTINTDGVFINDAKVIVADIEADNGVVHVIDMVLSLPTGIFNADVEKIGVYPNPANDYITVSYDSDREANFKLVSIDGRTVKSFNNVISGSRLNVSDIRKGTYILMKESGSQVSVSKIVITR